MPHRAPLRLAWVMPFAKLNAHATGTHPCLDRSNLGVDQIGLPKRACGQPSGSTGLGRIGTTRLHKLPLIGTRSPMLDGHWHFHCPECGMGDFELRHLAANQEFFCEVCVEDGRGEIRLERWTDDT
jgi:hypothetical protein